VFADRTTLPPGSAESHAHMAHSLVRYLGLESPSDLAPFGINSPGDLVDLLSRVQARYFVNFVVANKVY
jgi:hypothetical protein